MMLTEYYSVVGCAEFKIGLEKDVMPKGFRDALTWWS